MATPTKRLRNSVHAQRIALSGSTRIPVSAETAKAIDRVHEIIGHASEELCIVLEEHPSDPGRLTAALDQLRAAGHTAVDAMILANVKPPPQ